jgi:prepilin-type N-terminal cleavage/methylation domain-containing protein
MRLLRQNEQENQAGYSLVELLVVMTIFSGLLSIVFGVLITVQRQTKDTLSREQQIFQAKLGLAQIDRQVRSGNVLIDPTAPGELPRSLRVYTQTDGVRRCVQWQVTTPGLRFRSWDPGWNTGAGTVDPWRVIARDVRSDPAAPPTFEPVTTAGNSQAQSIRVRLWVKASDAGGKPVEATTVLTGRNTIYGYSADVCSPVPSA